MSSKADTNPLAVIEGLADKVADGVIDSTEVILRCGRLNDEFEHYDCDLLVDEVAWELKSREGLDYEAESIQRNLIAPVETVGKHYPSQEYTSPEVGDRVIHAIAGSLVVAEVVGVPGTTAGDYEITEAGMTVADAKGRHCPPNMPVVEIRHVATHGDVDGWEPPTRPVPLSRLAKAIDDQEADELDDESDESDENGIPEAEIRAQVDRMMETTDREYKSEEQKAEHREVLRSYITGGDE